MKSLKRILVLAEILLLTSALTACGGSAESSQKKKEEAETSGEEKNVELTLWTYPVGGRIFRYQPKL